MMIWHERREFGWPAAAELRMLASRDRRRRRGAKADRFLDRYRVGDEYHFVKLAGLVEVEGGRHDVRKPVWLMYYFSG